MKSLTRILTGMVMLVFFSVGAMAQISGTSTPTFIFDTRSTAVPLSWLAMGVVVVLIFGFLTRRHMLSRKKGRHLMQALFSVFNLTSHL